MKARGANFVDRNRIKHLAEEGYTADEISDIVRVEEKCVKGFMKSFGFEEKAPEPEPVKKKVKKKVAKKKVTKKD